MGKNISPSSHSALCLVLGLDKSNWRGPRRQRVITWYKLPSDKVRYIPATIILLGWLCVGKQWLGKLIEGFNEDFKIE